MVEEKTTSSKLSEFLEKNKKGVIAIFAVIIIALVAVIVLNTVNSSSTQKILSAIDEVTYEMVNESSSLEDSEIEARRNAALEKLIPLTKKAGIAGARANMLCAEIVYQQKKYDEALNYWTATVSKAKKSYLIPLSYYNIAVCNEQLGDADAAAENYKKAAESKDFSLANHAKFSYGRVLETKGDYEGAVKAYNELNDKAPDDEWAKIAKTRILALQIEGKAE